MVTVSTIKEKTLLSVIGFTFYITHFVKCYQIFTLLFI